MTIKIDTKIFLEILYFINDWLRLMGYGSEYARLARLVNSMRKIGIFKDIKIDKFYYINRVVEEFKRVEKLENNNG